MADSFQQILDAMTHPGRIVTLAEITSPPHCSFAAAIALMILANSTTPLHLAGRLTAMLCANTWPFTKAHPFVARCSVVSIFKQNWN